MIDSKKIRKIIITASALLAIALVSWLLYDNLVFRFKSTSPDLSSVATSSVHIKACVSQPIKTVGEVSFNNTPLDSSDFTVEGRCIKIPLEDLSEKQVYTVKIERVESKWFANKIPEVSFSFTPRYIEFSRLSTDQQKAQINASNSNQIDDPFLNNTFPIITDTFVLEIENGGDGKTVFLDVTILSEVPDYDNGGKITRVSDSEAEKVRADVVKLIKDRGGSIDKYFVTYSNSYLNEKYGSSIGTDH